MVLLPEKNQKRQFMAWRANQSGANVSPIAYMAVWGETFPKHKCMNVF